MAPLAAPAAGDTYEWSVTSTLCLVVLLGICGGLQFGYEIGVTGGVTSMAAFERRFFPAVYARQIETAGLFAKSPYCRFSDQRFQLFTSSIFLAASLATLPAAWLTRQRGRKASIVVAALCYLLGVGLNAGAVNLAMLVVGRLWQGAGVGFSLQAVPLYLSEMAPARRRGAVTIAFHLGASFGLLSAQITNYFTARITSDGNAFGWRVSLAGAGVPALALLAAGALLPDSPSSLAERGHPEAARAVLQRVRGKRANVAAEFADIEESARQSAGVLAPWRALLARRHRPQLVSAVLIPFFQEWTGLGALVVFGPEIFRILNHSESSALRIAIIQGAVHIVATIGSIVLVDRIGRKPLFLHGGLQMLACYITLAALLGVEFHRYGDDLSPSTAAVATALICYFIAAYSWSWGPLGILVTTEIQPLETRSASQSVSVVNFTFWQFVITQTYLSMLCTLRWGVFVFFGAWVLIMTAFVAAFFPETKGVPIECLEQVWHQHWFWRRYAEPKAEPLIPSDQEIGSDLGSGVELTASGLQRTSS